MQNHHACAKFEHKIHKDVLMQQVHREDCMQTSQVAFAGVVKCCCKYHNSKVDSVIPFWCDNPAPFVPRCLISVQISICVLFICSSIKVLPTK